MVETCKLKEQTMREFDRYKHLLRKAEYAKLSNNTARQESLKRKGIESESQHRHSKPLDWENNHTALFASTRHNNQSPFENKRNNHKDISTKNVSTLKF